MGDDAQAIHRFDAGPPAKRQTQTAADGLLGEDFRGRGAQGHDGVQVGDVPAFLQLVHVDDHFGLFVVLHRQQALHGLVGLVAGEVGMHLDDPALVVPLEKAIGFDDCLQRRGVGRILRHHQHERLDHRLVEAAGVVLQFHLDELVMVDAVLQLDFLQPLGADRIGAEILARRHRRNLHITVLQGAGERVVIDDVGELARVGAHRLGRRRQFDAEHRLQVVDRLGAGTGVITVGFVHQHHEVGQAGQVIEIGFAQVFLVAPHPRHARLGSALFVVAGVDLGNVEYVDVRRRVVGEQLAGDVLRHGDVQADAASILVVLAGDQHRRIVRQFGNALEHVLGAAGQEILLQLFVNGQIRREDEEMPAAPGDEQPGDDRPHQPRLADAGGERKAQGGEVALELFHRRVSGANRLQPMLEVGVLAQFQPFQQVGQDVQRLALRGAQGKCLGDLACSTASVDAFIHRTLPHRRRSARTHPLPRAALPARPGRRS